MNTGDAVAASLVAVNVKDSVRAVAEGGESLAAKLPYRFVPQSAEWNCIIFTKAGAADAQNRKGCPLPITLVSVLVDPAHVVEEPVPADAIPWEHSKSGQAMRSAVFVPAFADFGGRPGDVDIELDAGVLRAAFPVLEERRRFSDTVAVLSESIQR